MKIGIYGGLANNLYVFAHAMARQGMDVCFIRDRYDRYPMSQPVWEDVPFRLGYEEVPRASTWAWSKWSQLERDLKWLPPEWVYDPLPDVGGRAVMEGNRTSGMLDTVVLRWYSGSAHRTPVLCRMRSCDVLFVSGVEGSILANASGRPYVIWPFGGDLMIAAGVLRPPVYRTRTRLTHSLARRQLVSAYANAICIGAHEPTALKTDFYGVEYFLRRHKIEHVPIPIPTRRRSSSGDRRQALVRLLSDMGLNIPPSEYVGFVPSRIDYQWKGQDRLLRALAQLHREGNASNVHLIFSGWGQDFEKARLFVRDSGLRERVTFLDCALSKPILYEFYLSADFVVDQFIVGMCGTSALEAMACGAPLLTWINDTVERSWGTPPVLQARTEKEITKVLRDLSQGSLDLEGVGAALQEWVARVYDPAKVASVIGDIFAKV